ncbi:SNF2 family N-terminal domain-containing protein [Nonomuraea pusilla]|uniref:SNF2 family N-terminal domain-containing protein n=2 Tax=Nonomuraea pusilla TaxID=46177 RepID=A0A1H7FWB5_9ACTN|nr:SNF2 family N-terminal domain-containing protein [Nonomuraea pusilla]
MDNGTAMGGQRFASGMTVLVRGEEWLVTEAHELPGPEDAAPVTRLVVTGTSPLVRDQTAIFFHAEGLDRIKPLLPEHTYLVKDSTEGFRRSRLFIEALLRKTPLPQGEQRLATVGSHLVDDLLYQREPSKRAFANLRPRLLIADAVGLGKTLEIGLLLSELIRRGRGDRILVVTPRHILEQFQHELWTRFAIPLVALDSTGIARMQQRLPAGRNPFDYYKRVIASIDTLKSARYREQLRGVEWDAVVMDESHKLISKTSRNNQLARVLAPTTHAFILASATPHNGDDESFNELISLIDPTAIVDVKQRATREQLEHLYVRRHKMSPDVAAQIGAEWAKRAQPKFVDCPATKAEEAVLDELYETWIRPPDGRTAPLTGQGSQLFPITLLKAFLSSHTALLATIDERINEVGKRIKKDPGRTGQYLLEREALERLQTLAEVVRSEAAAEGSPDPAKLTALVKELKEIRVGPKSPTRVVIFSERKATIDWLYEVLPGRLDFEQPVAVGKEKGVTGPIRILHGGQSDDAQQRIVKDFALEDSDVRVLLTSDIAAEGVNLHRQCHNLVHYDIPWSLITIEQRNGRIDRYGQRASPQIRVLIHRSADPAHDADETVSKALARKEDAAHRTLGEAGALMGFRDEEREAESIEKAYLAGRDIDEVVPDKPDDEDDIFLAAARSVAADAGVARSRSEDEVLRQSRLFPSMKEFVKDAFTEAYGDPSAAIGLTWLEPADYPDTFEFELNRDTGRLSDLQRRLSALPQSYLDERQVLMKMTLTFSADVARRRLELARKNSGEKPKRKGAATKEQKAQESGWPDISYLTDQHPVIEWLVDKVLASNAAENAGTHRLTAPVIAAHVPEPVFLVNGRYSNRQGKPTVMAWMAFRALPTGFALDPREFVQVLHDAHVNGEMHLRDVGDLTALQARVPAAIEAARAEMRRRRAAEEDRLMAPLQEYAERLAVWEKENAVRFEQLTLIGVRARAEKRVRKTATALKELIEELATDGEPMLRLIAVLVPVQKGE